MRSKQQAICYMGIIEACRTEKQKNEKRQLYGIKESYLVLPFDPFRSTPVECLHTLLLGPYKYLFDDIMHCVSPSQKEKISAKIEAFPTSAFSRRLSRNAKCLQILQIIPWW